MMRLYQDPGVVAGWIVEQPFASAGVITHCGATSCLPSHRVPPHRHRGAEVMYLVMGEVTWSIGQEEVRQRAGEALVVGGRIRHGTSDLAHPRFRALFAGLDLSGGSREACQLRDELARCGGMLPPVAASELEPVLDGLYLVASDGLEHSAALAGKYGELLLGLICERWTTGRPADRARGILSPEMATVLAHLRANLHRKVGVAEMARIGDLSVRQFASRFRGEMGMSPAAWHAFARLQAARRALRSPGTSVTSVANEFGFSSSQHFSTAFRRVFASSPTVARSGGEGASEAGAAQGLLGLRLP